MAARTLREGITVTLSPSLLRRVARTQRTAQTRSRSAIFEEALNLWLREHARLRLDREVEEYYSSISAGERDEDRAWDDLATKSATAAWRK